jgi:oligosaccharide reducing-end xylanase
MRNLFLELGYKKEEIDKRLEDIVNRMFFGKEGEKIYYEVGEDMAYVMDTGNNDVRTEGMSYAMMIFVQLGNKEVFDRLWKWTKTYMFMENGENAGYFAWSVDPSGKKNSYGPAPDGEEYFALALFFASHRFGNARGIFDYEQEAQTLLSVCIHKGEEGSEGMPMWEPSNKLIKFVPNMDFSDPSYHLPHFYELFAKWAVEEDRTYWKEAAAASRDYLVKSCHPITGLAPEYATYEGEPKVYQNHHLFYSDSYRVAANIGLNELWMGHDESLSKCNERLQKFFCETSVGYEDYIYEVDGTRIDEKILHPVGLIATNAMASLATQGDNARRCVHKFWETPLREGERRYYDNFLYLFAFMALSGRYVIWDKDGV